MTKISNIIDIHKSYQPQTASVPSFRGQETLGLKNDTVEISNKKNKNNLGIKILCTLLGLGAIAFACIKLHKTSSVTQQEELSKELKEIQKLYKDIFNRDIDAKETKEFVKRYKQIIDSKTAGNDKEYCENLINEISKDHKTIKPEILKWETEPNPEITGVMSTSPDGRYFDIYTHWYRREGGNPAKEFFTSLFHEFRHVKQTEMIYRTDKEFFFEYLQNKFINNGEGNGYKEILRANNGDIEKAIQQTKELIRKHVDAHWGNLTPFEKASAEYKEGMRLIEGRKAYKPIEACSSFEEYANQTLEKEAYADENKASKLFDLLKQIIL